ncbi:glycosyltransferase family 87 protein [Oryzobacter telluris]|uniref:glycosyltransferase family 87 protein n=1 Tax=Oryzobacter telluris TaxID=3149179 RepID=UPI00370D3713
MNAGAPAAALRRTGWERVDRYLTRDRLVVYPAVVVVLFLVVWFISLPLRFPLPDFLSRWTAGRLVLDGRAAELYDPAVQSAVQLDLGATALSWFVSPPYVAALLVAFGGMPYAVAAVVWTLATLVLLWVTVRSLVALHPAFAALDGWRGLLLAGSCQAVLELVGAGQDSALVLAALVVGARLLADGRDPWAGLVLSVALVKPQLAWLVPVVLLARGAWTALGGFVAGALALLTVSLVVLGPQSWARWVETLGSPLYRTEVVGGQTEKNATLQGLVEHLVPGSGWPATALWLMGFAVLAVVAVRHRDRLAGMTLPVLLVTAVPLTTVLMTPHAMVYDLVVVLPAVVWLLAERPSPRLRGLAAVGYLLLFLSPLIQLVVLAVPSLAVLSAPWVVVVLVLLWRELGSPAVPLVLSGRTEGEQRVG